MKIIAVKFETTAYKDSARFKVPEAALGVLGLANHQRVGLVITEPNGRELYSGNQQMESGCEVYGEDMRRSIQPGQAIIVEVSSPQVSG